MNIKSLTSTSQDDSPSRTSATQRGGIPWGRPLARAPEGMGNPLTQGNYIIRLYHQDTREVVVDVNPPVSVYNATRPDFVCQTFLGLCWWPILEEYPFYVKYKGQLVCRWGGKKVVQQLPYERGPGARGVDQPEDLASQKAYL
ncbi:hypothetical protein JOM56_012113 [Amanita muscaria]